MLPYEFGHKYLHKIFDCLFSFPIKNNFDPRHSYQEVRLFQKLKSAELSDYEGMVVNSKRRQVHLLKN